MKFIKVPSDIKSGLLRLWLPAKRDTWVTFGDPFCKRRAIWISARTLIWTREYPKLLEETPPQIGDAQAQMVYDIARKCCLIETLTLN